MLHEIEESVSTSSLSLWKQKTNSSYSTCQRASEDKVQNSCSILIERHFDLELEDSWLTCSLGLAFRCGLFRLAWLLRSLKEFHRHPKDQGGREVKGWCEVWHAFKLIHIWDMLSHRQHTGKTCNRQKFQGLKQPLAENCTWLALLQLIIQCFGVKERSVRVYICTHMVISDAIASPEKVLDST